MFKFKHYILGLLTIMLLFSCSTPPKDEFVIVQEGKELRGKEIELKKKPFTIVSNIGEFSFVMAKEPIKMLATHKDIVKLVGTGAAWERGDALLYQPSALLSDGEACDAYFGYRKEGCELYIKEKKRLGFRKHYAYTFATYYLNRSKWRVEKIDDVPIEKRKEKHFYLYLFKTTDKLGEVALAEHVYRIKLLLK